MTRRVWMSGIGALLTSCGERAEWYPLPIQRAAVGGRQVALASIVAMESPRAEQHIVSGIVTMEPGANWRWTTERPELRFTLNDNQGLRFAMDFVIAEATFQQTGPVTLRFLLDGKEFARERYTAPGEKHFEKPMDPALLPVEKPFLIAVDVNPFFVSPIDRAKLGFLLVKIGFTP